MEIFTGTLGGFALVAAAALVVFNIRGEGGKLVVSVATVLAFLAGLRFIDAAPGGIVRACAKVLSFGWDLGPTFLAALAIAAVAGALFGGKPDIVVVVLAFAIPTLYVMALNGPYGPEIASVSHGIQQMWADAYRSANR